MQGFSAERTRLEMAKGGCSERTGRGYRGREGPSGVAAGSAPHWRASRQWHITAQPLRAKAVMAALRLFWNLYGQSGVEGIMGSGCGARVVGVARAPRRHPGACLRVYLAWEEGLWRGHVGFGGAGRGDSDLRDRRAGRGPGACRQVRLQLHRAVGSGGFPRHRRQGPLEQHHRGRRAR